MTGVPAILSLARQEARRVVLHPVTLVGWGLFILNAVMNLVVDYGPRSAYETVDTVISFYPGVLLILVGNLVASRDNRAGTLEVLAALPVQAGARTAALLAAAVPAAVVGLFLVLLVHVANLVLDRYEVAPGVGPILQGSVTLAGAVLLGVMVARWSPARMAIVLAVVAMVAVNMWLNSLEDSASLFGPMMGWARWGVYAESWGGLFAGSPGWRVGYLLGLCGLAALGAMLPVVSRPRRIVCAGLPVLALTALCGWLQLP